MSGHSSRATLWTALVLTAIPAVLIGIFLFNKTQFRGLPDWPSVSAENVRPGGRTWSAQHNGEWGISRVHFDATYVEFEYEVEGKHYRGDRGSANDASMPLTFGTSPQWRAYYSPRNPALAVLDPSPYRGSTGLPVAIAFTTVLGGAYWWLRWRHR